MMGRLIQVSVWLLLQICLSDAGGSWCNYGGDSVFCKYRCCDTDCCDGDEFDVAIIAGAVIGGIMGFALLTALICFCVCKKVAYGQATQVHRAPQISSSVNASYPKSQTGFHQPQMYPNQQQMYTHRQQMYPPQQQTYPPQPSAPPMDYAPYPGTVY